MSAPAGPFDLAFLVASLALAPPPSIENLADAVHQQIARFAGVEDAVTASRTCTRLRGPFNSDVTAMVITGEPSAGSVAGLLRHRPRLASLTVRGRWGIEPVAEAISSRLCQRLRHLTLIFPRADPPTIAQMESLSDAFSTRQLPALESLRVEHEEGPGSGEAKEELTHLLRGLIRPHDANKRGVHLPGHDRLPSPSWASLTLPSPLSLEELKRLTLIVQHRVKARAPPVVAPLTLWEGWSAVPPGEMDEEEERTRCVGCGRPRRSPGLRWRPVGHHGPAPPPPPAPAARLLPRRRARAILGAQRP